MDHRFPLPAPGRRYPAARPCQRGGRRFRSQRGIRARILCAAAAPPGDDPRSRRQCRDDRRLFQPRLSRSRSPASSRSPTTSAARNSQLNGVKAAVFAAAVDVRWRRGDGARPATTAIALPRRAAARIEVAASACRRCGGWDGSASASSRSTSRGTKLRCCRTIAIGSPASTRSASNATANMASPTSIGWRTASDLGRPRGGRHLADDPPDDPRNLLNLFYEEPDGDRWLPFDRYPRRIVRRIVRGRTRPGGQKRVFLNLCAGLDRLRLPTASTTMATRARHRASSPASSASRACSIRSCGKIRSCSAPRSIRIRSTTRAVRSSAGEAGSRPRPVVRGHVQAALDLRAVVAGRHRHRTLEPSQRLRQKPSTC